VNSMLAMDIVLAHPTDPFVPVEGGAVRYMLGLLRHLCDQGHRVTFIGMQMNGQMQSEKHFDFIPVSKGLQNWLAYVLSLLIKIPFISLPENAIIQTGRLDCMLPFVLFKPANPKVIISDKPLEQYAKAKFGWLFPLVAAIYHRVESYCLRRIDFLVTDQRTAEEYYLKLCPWLGDGKLQIASHAPVDLEVFKPADKWMARQCLGFDEGDDIVIFVGRIAAVKKIDFLINAFCLVRRKRMQAKLVIVGRGDDEEETCLKDLVQELDFRDAVIFTGEIHPNEVPQVMNCADVLALCSRLESGPIVVKEALACGVPVVSTDVGEVKNIVRDDLLGRVVTGDEKDFAQALIEVINMVSERPTEVRERCVSAAQPHSMEAFCQHMVEIYKAALVCRGYS
jgi:glycosyltransferase involved in cell wall biosynthesis